MKSVLMSIKPKYCELIAAGKKTIEVRKTKPRIETPFKCFYYECKGKEICKIIDIPKEQGGGQLMWTQAVCEDENGKIFKVFPLNRLVFCDNKFKKYFKED